MPSALVAISEGSEELEAIGIIDILKRGKVDVTIASVDESKRVKCAHGVTIVTQLCGEKIQDCGYADSRRQSSVVRRDRSSRRNARSSRLLIAVTILGASSRLQDAGFHVGEAEGERKGVRGNLRVACGCFRCGIDCVL